MSWFDRVLRGEKASPLQSPTPETPFPYDTYGPAQTVLPYPFEPYNGVPGQRHPSGLTVADPGVPLSWAHKGQVEKLWKSQPNVRKVVDFIARNIAGIPLHLYERVSDSDRPRVRDHMLSGILGEPRPGVSPYRFWHSVMSDGLLYDAWAVWMMPQEDGSVHLVQIPSWRLQLKTDALRIVTKASYWQGDRPIGTAARDDQWVDLPLDQLIFDHGYAPSSAGMSPMVTLADILAESAEAVAYRRQVWENGGRIPQYLHRPSTAPSWSKEARARFADDFRANYAGRKAVRAGGIPLLEDGMELRSAGDAFKPQDTMDLEGRRLNAIEVAGAFHIAPELVGAQQGNYSNVKEFRQMLYRDSLGPYIQAWEQALDTQMRRRLEPTRPLYIEANVESKLRGSFEEQAAVLTMATGAPWMTRGEARGMRNLPEIDGADELVVPLNVLVGGQSSPLDGQTAGGGGGTVDLEPEATTEPTATEPAPQTIGGFTADEIVKLVGAAATLIRSGFAPEASLIAVGLDPVEHLGLLPVTVQKPQVVDNVDEEIEEALKTARDIRLNVKARRKSAKAKPPKTHEEKAREVLSAFFAKQGQVVRSRIGAGDSKWWDGKRWDAELSGKLQALALLVTTYVGEKTANELGFDADDYDIGRTLAYLKAVADRIAGETNRTTQSQVKDALAAGADDEEDPLERVTHVFDVAASSRSEQASASLTTTFAGFAATEAARQTTGDNATKTWRVTSANPRASHAGMDGETVKIDATFSNGLEYPGSIGGGADETAGCRCILEINVP